MEIAVIGGTVFVGRHLVYAALERGHRVTIFHRGQRNPGLFPPDRYPDVTTVLGDRGNEPDLDALAAGSFDAVIDTCGYVPRVVGLSARKFAGKVPLYCFISSVSVYADMNQSGLTEDAASGTLADPTIEEVNGETYGPLKALCELEVQQAFPKGALIIRPGLIVGPFDPTDRFTYWPHRIARGGDVLCPGNPELHTQIIDCRDLAEWIIRLLERKTTGVFNAVGPDYPLTFGELFETCKSVSGSDANFIWVSEEFLQQQEVGAWIELPLWVPQSENAAGLDRISNARALAARLSIRPLSETVQDTLAWDLSRPQENAWKHTLKPEKEQAVLQSWSETRA